MQDKTGSSIVAHQKMHLQFFQSHKALTALLAIVPLLVAAMRPDVRLQARIEFERFAADVAGEFPFG